MLSNVFRRTYQKRCCAYYIALLFTIFEIQILLLIYRPIMLLTLIFCVIFNDLCFTWLCLRETVAKLNVINKITDLLICPLSPNINKSRRMTHPMRIIK